MSQATSTDLTNPFKCRLSSIKYQQFLEKISKGEYSHKRYGQAFYDFFGLHYHKNQPPLVRIYEADDERAKALICDTVDFV